ncbi:MAG: hypothetical protein L0J54_09740 [Halomonas sp.]|nr:hypothetical protein [Halomonas sp.]MDN6298288.1 hypothetical protein [Halomonas sp.]MDN6315533.1 hypothetical protein [Halomonas sp.]MDN6336890.1 hypothetical protein [Halomonas sp.]
MYPTHTTYSDQASCRAAGVAGAASRQPQRALHFRGKHIGGVRFAAVLGMLLGTLSLMAPGVQADAPGSNQATALFSVPIDSAPRGIAGGEAKANRLNDAALKRIRGRYVDARALERGAGGEENFVILWDERPAGGGTGEPPSSLSTGANNRQSTSVTTRREQ